MFSHPKSACLFYAIVLISLAPLTHIFAQSEQFCNIKNSSTQSGEVLNYKVYYTLAGAYIGAGEAQFSNQLVLWENKWVYHVKGTGKTYKSYDWFYKVRDVFESYIDTLSMKPLKFVRNVKEGPLRIYNQAIFRHQYNQAISTNRIVQIPDCVQDVLSAIYYARNIDFNSFAIGEKISFSLYLDDEVYPIYVRFLGKETIKTKYGTFRTIKFRPLLIDGTIFKGGEKMTVWVSDDANKIPVLVETPIVVGSIKVFLVGTENLRHKPSAMINLKAQ